MKFFSGRSVNFRAKFLAEVLEFLENSREFPENSFALIFTNIPENSQELSDYIEIETG